MSASLAQMGTAIFRSEALLLGPAHMQTLRILELTVLDLVTELLAISRYVFGCSSLLPPTRHRVRSPTLEVRSGSLMEMVKRRS